MIFLDRVAWILWLAQPQCPRPLSAGGCAVKNQLLVAEGWSHGSLHVWLGWGWKTESLFFSWRSCTRWDWSTYRERRIESSAQAFTFMVGGSN